jgi:hypothetical protein
MKQKYKIFKHIKKFITLFKVNSKILSCYDQHGIMTFYDTNMFLSHTFSRKNSNIELLIVFFNENTLQVLYIIAIYQPPQMNTNFFISILEKIVTIFFTNYPTIIIGDFNINMLTNTIESITLQNYMKTP